MTLRDAKYCTKTLPIRDQINKCEYTLNLYKTSAYRKLQNKQISVSTA